MADKYNEAIDQSFIMGVVDMSVKHVAEQGTHRELMDRKGFYYRLYAAQFE